MIRITGLLCLFYIFSNCQKNLDVIENPDMDILTQGIEILDSVQLIYSDSAFVRAIVTGPKMYRRKINRYSEDEFINGVHAEFYDREMNLQSTLDAGYALRKEKEDHIYVRNNVILKNQAGEKLETSELIWKEKEKKVTTEKAYKITRKDGTIVTGFGFTSNEDFSVFKSHSIQSRFQMRSKP